MAWRTRVVYLANPNNPTGTWFTRDELAAFLSDVPTGTLVVVDEAYIEYSTDPALRSALELLPAHPNLVVTRTFSKAYGLAGLRVGFLAAHPGLVAVMERVRESFNVNLPGLAASEAALGDDEHLAWVCRRTSEEREWLAGQLSARGIAVPPAQTNFLLADFGRDAGPVELQLVAGGVVPRPMAGYGLPTCLRLTVGNRDENRHLLQVLDAAAPGG
jgi:histidinol-phosphate aminotransferase